MTHHLIGQGKNRNYLSKNVIEPTIPKHNRKRLDFAVFTEDCRLYKYWEHKKEIPEYEQFLHCVKSVQIQSFSSPYFPVFGLNIKIYSDLHFSRSVC